MPASTRPRRTQAERRTETRRKLLDAAIDCLVEYGYGGLTTAKVVERAGVTRGAQAHHFQTKAGLVIAAIRHLALIRAEQAFDRLGRVMTAEDPLGDALDLLWDVHNGPMFIATTELWLAARTDPELRKQITLVELASADGLGAFVRRFPVTEQLRHELENFLYTAMDTVRGLMLAGFAEADEARLPARWLRAKADLRTLAETKLAANGVTWQQINKIVKNAAG